MRMLRLLALGLLGGLCGSHLPAQVTTTWNGNGLAGDWTDPANWTNGVPGVQDHAIIAPAVNTPSTLGAGATCDDLTIQATATLAIPPGSPITVNGDLDHQGAITGDGLIVLAGDGTVTTGGSSTLHDVDVTGTQYTFTAPMTLNGDLRHLTGTLTVSGTGQRLRVRGDADFSGVTVNRTSTPVLEIGGLCTFATSGTVNNAPSIDAEGDFVSNLRFQPNARVTMAGSTGPQTLTVSGTTFTDLTISSKSTVSTGSLLRTTGTLRVRGQLTSGHSSIRVLPGGRLLVDGTGTLTASSATLDLDGDFDILAGGMVTVASATHTLSAGADIAGTLNSGTSTFVFDGSGAIATRNGASFPDVDIASGATAYAIGPALITGDLQHLGGVLTIAGSAMVTQVLGNASFTGTNVGVAANPILDVDGDATFMTSGTVTAVPLINVAGTFTADASFMPTTGHVTFDGSSPQTILASASTFPRITVSGGAMVTVGHDVITSDRLAILNTGLLTLTGGSILDLDGDLDVLLGGTLTLGAGGRAHTFTGGVSMAGTLNLGGATTFEFDGTGSITAPGSALPTVEITTGATSYTILGSPTINGNLTHQAGALTISGSGQRVTVQGNATFSGMTVSVVFNPTLDVSGNVIFATSNAVTTSPAIEVEGDFTANPLFQPTGRVTFDGVLTQTVSAAGVTFASVTVAAGAMVSISHALMATGTVLIEGTLSTTATSITVGSGGLLRVEGTLTASSALLDLDGDLEVAGGSLSLATGIHTLSAGANVAGTVSAGASTFVFDGTGTITTTGGFSLPDVDIGAGATAYTVGPALIAGDFDHLAGTLTIAGSGLTTHVTGNALFTGSGLGVSLNPILDLDGNVTFSTASSIATIPRTFVEGNFMATSTFSPTAGKVTFDGPALQTISAAASSFPWVEVALGSQVTVAHDLVVSGRLDVMDNATLTVSSGALDVEDDVVVTLGGALTLNQAAATHTFASGASITGTLSVAAGSTFAFEGAGSVAGGGNTLPTLDFVPASTAYTLSGDNTIGGNLLHRGGSLAFSGTQGTVSVANNALFSGITVTDNAVTLLSVDGDINFATSAPVTTPPNVIAVSGDWTSNANWTPATGTVSFTGTGTQTVTAATFSLPTLNVGESSNLNLIVANLTVQNDLTVSGTMNTPSSSMAVQRDLIVNPSAQVTVGPGSHTVGRDLTNNGAILGPGTLALIGGGSWSGTGSHGSIEVRSSSTMLLISAISVGTLDVTDGVFDVGTNTIQVSGDATLSGGTLEGQITGLLDVEGSMTFSGTTAGATVPEIRCAGDYTAGTAFAPTNGTVYLDGTAPSMICSLAAGEAVQFYNVQIDNGVRSAGAALNIQGTAAGASAFVSAGATFDIGPENISITQCMNFVVEGGMTINTGGSVAFDGDSTVTVRAIGTMRMLGSPGSPVCFVGAGGGGYSATFEGTLEASYFEFREMGPAGIQIASSATLTTFDNGLFDEGTGVLLSIERIAPITLYDIDFENTGGAATANVTSSSSPPDIITFANYGGAFSGPTFENDPNGVIEWTTPGRTSLQSFTASSGVGRIELAFTTTQEIDVRQFHVLRATDPRGSYVSIGSPIAATGTGSGASYSLTDTSVVYPTTYHYRLEEERNSGSMRLLGTDFARPYPSSGTVGLTSFVGPGGYPSIRSALTAVPAGTTIIVSPGTYAAFSMSQPNRILAATPGTVTINTSSEPLEIRDIGFSATTPDIVLSGLTVGDGTTSNGLEIVNVDAVVVLDEVTARVSSGDGLLIDDAPKVAVQSPDIKGGDGMRVRNASTVYLSSGQVSLLHVETGSTVTHAGVTPSTTNKDGTSTVNVLTGAMPRVDFAHTWPVGKSVPVTVTSDPGDAWALILAASKDWVMLDALGYDMIMLQSPLFLATMSLGLIPETGTSEFDFAVPDLASSSWGVSLPLQLVKIDLGTGGRMGNVRDPVILP